MEESEKAKEMKYGPEEDANSSAVYVTLAF